MGLFDKKTDKKAQNPLAGGARNDVVEPSASGGNMPGNDEFYQAVNAPDSGGNGYANSGEAEVVMPNMAATETWPRLALPKELTISYTDEGVAVSFTLDKRFADEQRESLTRHFARKEIAGIDTFLIMNALNDAACQNLVIAPPQLEKFYDEVYTVVVSQNQLEAYITVLPADPAGGKKLDPDAVLHDLQFKHGIKFGIDNFAVETALASHIYDEPICIARGRAAIPGEDGSLEFLFDKREDGTMNRVRQIEEEDRVDYKSLDLFERVRKDQLLVRRILPKDGVPGVTVLGQILPAEAGKAFNLPIGKNTYTSADKMELYAKESGSVEFVNGTVRVSHCYMVENVDLKVGNIDFDGDVIVTGNVLAGFTVKATGSIEIMGMAEAANIQADGDIFIRGGIQGAGKGMLTAKGNIFVKFAENATLQGNEMVVAESLLHSNVSSFGAIEVLNGKGCIIGGNVCAGTYVAAQLVGNGSGRATNIEVGISPRYRARLLELEEQLKAVETDINKIQMVATRPPRPNETPKQKEYRMELMKVLLVQNRLKDDCLEEINDLKERMEEMQNGQVHVLREAFPGVKINIGIAQFSLEKSYPYATFRLRDGEINFTNCRFKQMPVRPKRIRRG